MSERQERDVQKVSIYMPREVYEALREAAFLEHTSINKLVLEAVEDGLQDIVRRAVGKAHVHGDKDRLLKLGPAFLAMSEAIEARRGAGKPKTTKKGG